jgi:uncharacterized protein with NAD-binding domain and iron-sulfur cluster
VTAPLIDQLLCPRCATTRVADVTATGEVTYRPCPCQTRDHATRTRTEAAQRAEAATAYDRGRRFRRTRERA